MIDVKKILNFIQRYFIHRTGVKPHDYVCIYLEQELNKAKSNKMISHTLESIESFILDERKNFQTLEDIYMVCIELKKNFSHIFSNRIFSFHLSIK